MFPEDEARNAEFARWAEEEAREKREHLLQPEVTSARYEPDLLQYQRALRAAEANRRKGFDLRVDGRMTPEQARQIRAGSDQANFRRKTDRKLGAMSFEQRQETLPACAQDFFRGRMTADPVAITLHRGGSLPNRFGYHVTYGNDIHLTEGTFDRRDEKALWDKFHEIGHVDQNARLGLGPLDHGAAYMVFGGHDASPYEKAADSFADEARNDYFAAGLNKKCRF